MNAYIPVSAGICVILFRGAEQLGSGGAITGRCKSTLEPRDATTVEFPPTLADPGTPCLSSSL